MSEFEPRPISRDAIPAALEKAERYRLLNEPHEAISICRDVLRAHPDHQVALVTLILALSDRFGRATSADPDEARTLAARLEDDYRRAYYTGIVCERRAKALLRGSVPGAASTAHDWLRMAMEWYEKAEPLRPEGNDDPILRWNACVRLMRDRELGPRPEDAYEQPIE
ncbi:MAG: hypothetical protein R3199_04075 [Gemmatimonadota bacterium]|nr:hypothetical protein [Gemmatimonadota bacterium]